MIRNMENREKIDPEERTGILEYLSEDELRALMEQVESQEMLRAPARLKEDVMAQIRRGREKSGKRQILLYRAKVLAAMAAALTFLVLLPDDGAEKPGQESVMQQTAENMEQMAIEHQKDAQDQWERYRRARESGGIKEIFQNFNERITELTGADREEDHAEKEE